MNIENIKSIIQTTKFKNTTDFIEHILNLYSEKRIDNTDVWADGDMLLYQWGTYDWGDGEFFEIDLTRQVIPDSEDIDEATDNMQQLRAALKFTPSELTNNLGAGNEWCSVPSNVPEFKRYIFKNKAFNWAKNNIPIRQDIELTYI